MNKLIVMFVALALGSGSLSGCANMSETQKDTGTGAAIGAVAGAVLGGLTAGGNPGRSAATGAAWARRWARAAAICGKHMQEQKAAMEQATRVRASASARPRTIS